MLRQRRFIFLLVLLLLISISGIWGTWFWLQSSSSPATIPTLAHIANVDTNFVANQQVNQPISSDNEASPTIAADDLLAPIGNQADTVQDIIPNHYVLELSDVLNNVDITDYVASLDVEIVETIAELNRIVIVADADKIEQLSTDIVISSEPDYYAFALLSLPPSDPFYDDQWNIDMIGAPMAWEELPDSPTPIRVAVIDSGMCFDHPDMQGIYTDFQYDYVDDDDVPQDALGHGCSVTSVINSQPNDIGIMGIAPFVEIMSLRVLDDNGNGTYSNIAQAIVDATNHGVQIINLSLGGYSNSNTLRAAVDYALSNDVYVVAATGNNGQTTPLYPARYAGVIAVGSVDESGDISSYSNRDEDTLAPGTSILVAHNNDYSYRTGTSLAVPHVVGVIALELALDREPVIDGDVISVQLFDTPIEDPTPTPTDTQFTTKNGQLVPYVTPTETVMTDRWVVKLESGTDPNALASQLGFINWGQVGTLEGYYVFAQVGTGESEALALSAGQALSTSPLILEFHQEIELHREFQVVPTDPLVSEQWHLINTGQSGGTAGVDINVNDIWDDGYDGSGVTVAIVDSGLEYTHPDFVSKYNASASYDYNGTDTGSTLDEDNDPFPEIPSEGHGTSVGGVAAADDDGSECGVGVAFNADISGLRLLGDGHAFTDSQEADAFTYANQINDIYNNSWGIQGSGTFLSGPGPLASAALEDGVLNGRGGLGSIYVFAAGNGGVNLDHSGADGYPNSRYTIAVSATDDNGILSNYSEIGTSILVNAPSNPTSTSDPTLDPEGIVTTDRTGTAGYNNVMGFSEDCTDNFGGTSSATPVVSGVIALMLQANPNLTWRDVQHILVESSFKNHPAHALWNTNGAGRDFNIFYGFGTIDATAAVNMAETWVNVKSEISLDSGIIPSVSSIPDVGAPVNFQHIESENITIESVEIYWDADHTYRGDLEFSLTSPSGTTSLIYLARILDNFNGPFIWTTTSMEFWGEESAGTWTLSVQDVFAGDFGQMNAFAIKFNGTQGEYRVTTTVDENNGCSTGNCSLREAIIAANAYGDGARVIIPAGTFNLSIAGTGEDASATGDLDITANIHIIGTGRDQTIIDANQIDRVFDIFSNSKIEYLTVTGGIAPNGEDGGGIRINENTFTSDPVELNGLRIFNNSTVNGFGGGVAAVGTDTNNSFETHITHSIVEGNSALNGGGISFHKSGRSFVNETHIDANTATNLGGGLYANFNNGVIYTASSTISNNTAQSGGGFYLTDLAYLTILHSTVSGNSANENGGGFNFVGSSGIIGVGLTITENIADSDSSNTGDGGGLAVNTSIDTLIELADSIIAGNIDNSGTAPDCYSGDYSLESLSRNILGDTTGCLTTLTLYPLYNNYDFLNVDPLVASLSDNGGYTPTHALLANSPAIDKTPQQVCRSLLGYDQRGVLTNQNMICDIGAYEYEAVPSSISLHLSSVGHQQAGSVTNHSLSDFNFGGSVYNNYFSVDTAPTVLVLGFNRSVKDMFGDSQLNDVTNLANYVLVADGANAVFDTNTCGTPQVDDVAITIDSLWHTQANNTLYLNLNGATDLSADSYRLIACNLIDQENNLMDVFIYDFIVGDAFSLGIELESTSPATVHTLEEIHEYDTAQDHIDAHFTHPANDPAGDTNANDVTNPNNYRIITSGSDGIFQTDSCVVQGDDQQLGIDSVTYFPTGSRATVNLTSPLIDGIYRFIACDELEDTSNQSLDGNKDGIDGGDYVSQFIVFPKPTNVTGTSNLGQVTIRWDDLAESETGYAIERRENISGTGWAEVGIAAINATAFVDFSAHCDTEYIYRVQTRRDTDMVRSGYSDEVIVNNGCSSNLFIVNSTADTNDGVCDGVSCSLREAIIAANAFGDGAIVSIPADTYTLSIPGTGEDAAATGDLDITANIHIIGAGRDQTIIDANQIDRVFDVLSPIYNVTGTQIEAVTITGGQPENGANGGGVRFLADIDSHLVLGNVRITDNTSTGNGGGFASEYLTPIVDISTNTVGIYGSIIDQNTAVNGGGLFTNSSQLNITDSSINNNDASDKGGGSFITENGDQLSAHTTIRHNTAHRGGGAYFLGFPNNELSENDVFALFENSTISNNSALTDGGGLVTENQVRSFIRFTTIAENIADSDNNNDGDGGGLYYDDVTTIDINSFFSSILYDNLDLSGQDNDCAAQPHVTFSHFWTSLFPEMSNCIVGGTTRNFIGVAPILGALTDNGGPTLTHSIPSDNVGIDTGFFQQLFSYYHLTDQRGQYRNPWGEIDAGSFDYSPEPFNDLPQLVDIGLHSSNGTVYQSYQPIWSTYKSFNINGDDIWTLVVYFDELLDNPVGNSVTHDVTNPDNYMIVADGGDETFSTTSCSATVGDDIQIAIAPTVINPISGDPYSVDAVEFQPFGKRALLAFASELANDEYRLIICNLRDLDGNQLDGNGDGTEGDPIIFDFAYMSRVSIIVGSPTIPSFTNRLHNQFVATVNDPMDSLSVKYSYSPDNIFDPNGDTNPNDVTNPDNYLLVSAGSDDNLDTNTCGATSGDDVEVSTSLIQNSNDDYDLNINDTLADSLFRLIICNIQAQDGTLMDGDWDYREGGDFTADFIVFRRPTNITGTHVNGEINLTWDDNSTTESKYVVEKRTTNTGWLVLGETASDVTNLGDTDLICDTDYIYRVYGFRASDTTHSGYSNEMTFDFTCDPMIDPDNLIATPVSGTHIDLTWNDNNGLETAYKIERRISGEPSFVEIGEAPANSTTFIDSTIVCDVNYEYQVRAYRSYDDAHSNYSNTASATVDCPPLAPSSLVVNTVIGFEQLDLTWVDNSNNETEYRIERSPVGASTWTQIDAVAADATTYSDIDVALACYTGYDYRVIAFRASDSAASLPSNTATGTTSCTTVIAPTNLSGTLNETTTDLFWTDNSPDEDNFQIQRADASINNWTTLGTSPANLPTFNDATTTCGNSYDYRVRAQRSGVDSDFSNVFTIQQTCPPPSAPSDLTLTSLPFSNDIQLDWADNAVSETDFYIERSADGVSGWAQIATVGENVVTYTDTDAGLLCYTPYYYQVRAYRSDDGVFSDYSPIVNISTWCDPDLVGSQVFTVNAPTSDVSSVVGFPAPSCAPNMNHAYVWEFPSSAPQALSLTTFGSPFDTVMSIWSFDGTSYIEVACNDNAAMDGTSALAYTFPASPSHMVIVGGKNNASGTITLNSSQIVPPTATPVPTNTAVPTATDTPNLTTVGLFQDGLWLFRDSNSTGVTDVVIRFGQQLGSGWTPLLGDWNGDGTDGIGLYKDGRWLLRDVVESSSHFDYQFIFGATESGWQPVVGDWDGDGDDGVGLYKNGIWMLKNDPAGGTADYTFRFNLNGSSTAKAIAGDWHDESKDRVGLYDNGRWFLSYSHQTDNNAKVFDFGPNDSSWMPVTGDWDKDGDDTIGVYKDTGWRLRNNNSRGNPDLGFTFGLLDAVPVAGYRGEAGGLALLAAISDDTSISDAPTMTATAIFIEATEESVTYTPTATEAVVVPTDTAIPVPTRTQTPTHTPTLLPSPTATLTPLPTATEEPPVVPENVSGS